MRSAFPSGQRGFEHGFEHRGSQPTGVGIVPRAVIAVIKYDAIWHDMARAMAKAVFRQFSAQGLDRRLMCDLPKRDHGGQRRQGGDAAFKKGTALVDFGWQRLVLRRQAMNRIADHRAFQRQSVIDARVIGALGQPVFQQRRKQQVAGIIACKRAAGAIGAVHAGRKADNQKPGIGITETGHGRVEPVGMFGAQFIAERGKTRTVGTVAGRINGQ